MAKAAADNYIDVAMWYQYLQDTSNDAFLPLFFDRHRYLVLMGGGGSGKSEFAGRKVLERATSEAGHRFLVCRKVAKTLRESCFRQLVSQLNRYYPHLREGNLKKGADYSINRTDMQINFHNGSAIIFCGLDDVEKLKSIYEITDAWIEEASELLESDFNQLDIRMRGKSPWYRQMILSFNPISILHWLKKRFWDHRDPRARTHRSTYLDNRFLSDEDVTTLLSFKDTDPYYYSVYALGEWGVLGKSVFDAEAVTRQLLKNIQPVKRGYFRYQLRGSIDTQLVVDDISWVDDAGGAISIYAEPEPGRPYVIGGDTAGEGSDQFCGQVIDNISCRQMAVLHHSYDEDLYTMQMYCLGRYYNDALLGIEANFSSYPNKVLGALGYGHLVVREIEDTFTGKIRQAYGVLTNNKTRPVMIAGLVKAMRDDISTVVDRGTLEEMLTFVRNEDFRAEAEEGAHDDTVMALAIAHYIRPQGSFDSGKDSPKAKVKWTDDMYEDYYKASTSEQAYLLEEWGDPF